MRTVELTLERTKVISGIFANLGQVFFASSVIPFLFPTAVSPQISTASFGLLVALLCWLISIIFVKE
ncbi:MAG TPA: hypothetical protein VGA53_03920 [Candidatus Paceibacterota bacterium]